MKMFQPPFTFCVLKAKPRTIVATNLAINIKAMQADVLIIGAGAAGLYAARQL